MKLFDMKIKNLAYSFMELVHMKMKTLYLGMRFLSRADRIQCLVLPVTVSSLFSFLDQFQIYTSQVDNSSFYGAATTSGRPKKQLTSMETIDPLS